MLKQERVVIDKVTPQINEGQFSIKRVVGQHVEVSADVLADGHDIIAASVLYKHSDQKTWSEVRMSPTHNDVWQASFKVEKQGVYTYKIQGWIDYALNWQYGIGRKVADQQHVSSELLEGVNHVENLLKKANKKEKDYLVKLIDLFKNEQSYEAAVKEAVGDKLQSIFEKYPEKKLANTSHELGIYVDRKKALFSTWYEFFPRSASQKKNRHGTFKDCVPLLDRVAAMGFDTLYFPPIHPIGEVNRKGKNNTTEAKPDDVGSCWGIGSRFGGHKDIHPELGSLEDFKALVARAKELDIEIAMDYALQAAPDHPWVSEHP
jgi:starch synthase (maltosyl-transferring)